MKKILFALFASLAVSGFAAQLYQITFETKGPDYYKDGTVVADGECYALVFVRSGQTFQGFLADGSVADPDNSRALIVKPIAVDGHCETYSYQPHPTFIAGLGSGGYVVCLLDTRGPDGKPMGAFAADANGLKVPVAVNGYSVIDGAPVNAEVIADTKTTLKSVAFTTSAQVDAVAALPVAEEELKPVIKSAEVKDGKFVVTVEKAVPYLKYDLTKGAAPNVMTTQNAADEVKPGLTETIELKTDATGSAQFFKVTADRNQ